MNELNAIVSVTEKFNYEGSEIRSVLIDDEPWFVGKDVATVLGYSNASKAVITHVDEEDKRFEMMPVSDSQNGNVVKTAIISESGVYSLILHSKLPTAKKFKRWVTSEVLPTIRRHGLYATPEAAYEFMQRPETLIAMLQEIQRGREEKEKLQSRLAVVEPKARYYDYVLQGVDLVTTTSIARDYGMSAQEFNKLLAENKIQFRQGKLWHVYANLADKGYTKISTCPYFDNYGRPRNNMLTKWTQKGRLFIYDTLKAKGILPLMERESMISANNQ